MDQDRAREEIAETEEKLRCAAARHEWQTRYRPGTEEERHAAYKHALAAWAADVVREGWERDGYKEGQP